MKGKLSLLLSALLLISLLVSCASESKGDNTVVTTTAAQVTEETEATTTKIDPGLPDDIRYDGYEFRVLTKGLTNVHWKSFDIAATEINGEPLNDAVYSRNLSISEKYGVTVVDIPGNYNDLQGQARKAIAAGDDMYDMLCFQPTSLIADGYLVNLFEIPYLNLEQPYYDQNCVESFAIGGKLFCVTGDMLTMDNNATWCVQFNKKIVEDFNFGETYGKSMYDLVNDGQWTLDVLYDTIKIVTEDLNGDGVMKELVDRWGMQTEGYNFYSMLVGAGERIAVTDSDGYPVITLDGERIVSALEKIVEIQRDKLHVLDAGMPQGYADVWGEVMDTNFQQGLVLYNMAGLNRVTLFRSMEVDFGILPIPKYDDAQVGYFNPVSLGCANFITIPMTSTDLERTGIIIEALSCESKYTLLPAYYDITLKTKASRDEESSAMLDLIFATTVFDIGAFFNWGNAQGIITGLTDAGTFTSKLASSEKATNAAMEKTMTAIENLESVY